VIDVVKFETQANGLYIDGRKVLRGWESWNGWYWFATEEIRDQLSDLGNGKGTPDTIWFGYVQGFEEEWGYFSQAEIERLKPRTWEIPRKDLLYSGRRKY
jgi:hypothetical protein